MPHPNGGPAFPQALDKVNGEVIASYHMRDGAGMSLRAYFAAAALPAVIAHPHATDGSPREVAEVTWAIAQAMVAAEPKP